MNVKTQHIRFCGCTQGKILVLGTFIGKGEMPQINDFSFHFKKQEKEGQVRTKVSRRKEIIDQGRGKSMK